MAGQAFRFLLLSLLDAPVVVPISAVQPANRSKEATFSDGVD
jgi:hypothetical protein